MIIENFPADFLLGKYELKGVKAYGNKFMLTKPERLLSLIKRVSQELNVNEDKLDYSENSLDYITEWLKEHISTRKLTKAEYELNPNRSLGFLGAVRSEERRVGKEC